MYWQKTLASGNVISYIGLFYNWRVISVKPSKDVFLDGDDDGYDGDDDGNADYDSDDGYDGDVDDDSDHGYDDNGDGDDSDGNDIDELITLLEHVPCARHSWTYFICINSFNPHDNTMRFYEWKVTITWNWIHMLRISIYQSNLLNHGCTMTCQGNFEKM